MGARVEVIGPKFIGIEPIIPESPYAIPPILERIIGTGIGDDFKTETLPIQSMKREDGEVLYRFKVTQPGLYRVTRERDAVRETEEYYAVFADKLIFRPGDRSEDKVIQTILRYTPINPLAAAQMVLGKRIPS